MTWFPGDNHAKSGPVRFPTFVAVLILFANGCAAPVQAKPRPRINHLTTLNSSFRALSKKVSPSVVQILAAGYAPVPVGGGHVLAKRRTTGSGVIVSAEGHILTNAHVVQGASQVQVRMARKALPKGRSILKPAGQVLDAKIVGLDPETDLAVLKVKEDDLSVAAFGSSEALTPGELVFAFGAPFGLEGTVTMGVVSAVARQRRPDDSMVFIQTDAPINPGNSGGPLVNARGEVVGINTFIVSPSSGSSGVGFAVPSNIAENVYKQLKTTGRVRRGIIGAITQSITPPLAEGLGLPRSNGVVVADIYPRSPAEKAGLQVGDVIVALDGKPMENARQFDVNVYGRRDGDSVTLSLLRGGESLELNVLVLERPEAVDNMATRVDPAENLVVQLGILGLDLTPKLQKMVPRLRIESGVLVVAASPGEAAGVLRVGDIIHKVNGQSVSGLADLRSRLVDLTEGDPVILQIERLGVLSFVPLFVE